MGFVSTSLTSPHKVLINVICLYVTPVVHVFHDMTEKEDEWNVWYDIYSAILFTQLVWRDCDSSRYLQLINTGVHPHELISYNLNLLLCLIDMHCTLPWGQKALMGWLILYSVGYLKQDPTVVFNSVGSLTQEAIVFKWGSQWDI